MYAMNHGTVLLYFAWQTAVVAAAWYHDVNGLLMCALFGFLAPIVAMRLLED